MMQLGSRGKDLQKPVKQHREIYYFSLADVKFLH